MLKTDISLREVKAAGVDHGVNLVGLRDENKVLDESCQRITFKMNIGYRQSLTFSRRRQ